MAPFHITTHHHPIAEFSHMDRTFFIVASILGGLAVALGAFGAHALRDHLTPESLDTFRTGVTYQMYHALALLAVAAAISRLPQTSLLTVAGWLFIAGTILFSGSLYVLTITGVRWLGAVTPLGGVAYIAGWSCLALAFLRN
jgi:uncharacterized membrane protein YgdD (TMEM256/DUF423 family)